MFGSHLSISGGMVNALFEAEQLGMETVQVFTKNQQQWKAPPLSESASADWLRELKRLGWQSRTVSHASYLINLASHDDELFAKSVDLMTDEIERCEALSIPFLVHHPGSFVGWTREQGIARIASAYRELSKRTKGYNHRLSRRRQRRWLPNRRPVRRPRHSPRSHYRSHRRTQANRLLSRQLPPARRWPRHEHPRCRSSNA
jgi:endonuclease IV